MFQNASHHLSSEQIRFLNRGPTYIVPCQMHLLSTSPTTTTLEQILTKQMMPLQEQLTKLFNHYPVIPAYRHRFQRALEQLFIKSFSQPIPSAIEQRAFYEKQLLQSIQSQLKQDQLILRRTADENNCYYLGYLDDFNQMAQDHIENSHCYEMIGIIDELNTEQQHLTKIIQSIDSTIEEFAQKRLIPADRLYKLTMSKRTTNFNLPYLYFLPKINQNDQVVLQPRLSSCKNAPIRTLANFLDQILRPFFENFSQSTTLLDGHDFLQKLQQYCMQMDGLTPNTKFITFQIHNLSTRVSHADLLTALNRFLVHPLVTHHYQPFTINAIQELTALVLRHHIFTYNGKIYRYIKGSPLNYAFTQLLVDIYLQQWQIPLVREIRTADQFYGRYHDIGILTWNETSHPLHICINELNEQNPDIQLTTSVGVHVHFLHAYIENQQGLLYTRVYHDPMIQPFLLPYASDHPRLVHRQWFRFALVRAGQYCSSFEDFQEERVQIELTFLANGYSLDFVQFHVKQFLKRFSPFDQPINLHRLTYTSFRQQLFRYFNQRKLDLKQQPPVESIPKHRLSQLHYLYDWGTRYEFNQKFYELWSTILNKDPLFSKFRLKIRLHSKHCYLSNTLLVQYKTNPS